MRYMTIAMEMNKWIYKSDNLLTSMMIGEAPQSNYDKDSW